MSTMTMVTSGLAGAVQRLFDTGFSHFNYLAVGPSSLAVAVTQTALQGVEIQRVLCTTGTEIVYASNVATITKTLTFAAAATVEEVGIFNASAAGVMLGRGLTGTTAVAIVDKITFTVSVTQS